MDAIAISRSGLDVEWRRMEVIALNLANMESTGGPDGKGYVPLHLLSGPAESFGQILNGMYTPEGVKVYGIEPSKGGTRRVYEPTNPHADSAGFVTRPNVSHADEMTLMVKTARVYEANLVAMSAAQQIYSAALQIGRQQ